MKTIVTATLAALVVSLSAPAAAACKGKAATETTASSTDKAAPAQKSATVTPSTPATTTTTTTTTAAPALPQQTPEAFTIVAVDEVSKALDEAKKNKKQPYAVFDANTAETRQKDGVIPTAVLLSSSSDYDLALLPKDKATPVVFYCANEKCTASHTAAKRAAHAGHTTVKVLGPGIKGWVAAGKAVDKPAA